MAKIHIAYRAKKLNLCWSIACIVFMTFTTCLDKACSLESNNSQSVNPETTLSAGAKQIIQVAGISILMKQLDSLHTKLADRNTDKFDTKTIVLRQDFLSTKEHLLEKIEITDLEVRSILSRIDVQLALIQSKKAKIAADENRELKFITSANFISGGITKLVSNSMKLESNLDFPANILDIIDGVVQTTLPLITFHRIHIDDSIAVQTPQIIGALFDIKSQYRDSCPQSVWNYLDLTAPDSLDNLSRRDSLTKSWINRKIISTRYLRKTRSGQMKGHRHVAIEALDDQLSMLFDLQATVSRIDRDLLDLVSYIHNHYQDPLLPSVD